MACRRAGGEAFAPQVDRIDDKEQKRNHGKQGANEKEDYRQREADAVCERSFEFVADPGGGSGDDGRRRLQKNCDR